MELIDERGITLKWLIMPVWFEILGHRGHLLSSLIPHSLLVVFAFSSSPAANAFLDLRKRFIVK